MWYLRIDHPSLSLYEPSPVASPCNQRAVTPVGRADGVRCHAEPLQRSEVVEEEATGLCWQRKVFGHEFITMQTQLSI